MMNNSKKIKELELDKRSGHISDINIVGDIKCGECMIFTLSIIDNALLEKIEVDYYFDESEIYEDNFFKEFRDKVSFSIEEDFDSFINRNRIVEDKCKEILLRELDKNILKLQNMKGDVCDE